MANKLTELANKYHSDKGDTYLCAHHYTEYYQKIFKDLVDKKITLLEIGLNRDGALDIPSIKMWKEYFSNIKIYGMDIISNYKIFNSPKNGVNIIIADQSNVHDLRQVGTLKFNVIIDDSYHASKHQQIILKTLWKNLKAGGMYIIEDLHYQPIGDEVSSTKTKKLLQEWKMGNFIDTNWISQEEVDSIAKEVDHIELYDSQSKNWGDSVKDAFAVIYKVGMVSTAA